MDVDLTNPSPLIMTRFERISTIAAVSAVIIAMLWDYWKARGQLKRPSKPQQQ
jgi:hypothetical protein